MLGLYLYTLIIVHRSCNILSILNTLTLQKELQKSVTNNGFLDKKEKHNKKNKKSNKNPCRSRELNPGTSRTQSGCVTTAPPSQLRVQLRVSIVVKLFNCFDAMGQNVNKVEFAGHTFSSNFFFSVFFNMHG